MKIKPAFQALLTTAVIAITTSTANAALFDRGNVLVYDSTWNITWLSDLNYAQTSGFAAANVGGTGRNEIRANGQMGWDAGSRWVGNLTFAGFSDWRMPLIDPFDPTCPNQFAGGIRTGRGCTGSELPSLINIYSRTTPTRQLFQNFTNGTYFSGVYFDQMIPNLPPELEVVFGLDTSLGSQFEYNGLFFKDVPAYIIAVRDGDVTGSASVPEPTTLALFTTVLGGVGLSRRKRAVAQA